ncbi:MAG: CapA family protein [Clostridia bacterium]|nr:CapA family protein [Clostridia bacterium]
MKRLYLLIFLMLTLCTAAFAGELSLTAPESLRPYINKNISVFAPAAGTLELALSDGTSSFVLYSNEVPAGESVIPLNGLHFNGEAVPRGAYTLTASLQTNEKALTQSQPLRILPPAAALQYCIPSSFTVYAGYEGFQVNYLITADALMHVKLYKAKDPQTALRTWSIQQDDLLPHAFKWDGKINSKKAAEGDYILTFKVKNSEQEAFSFPLRVTHDAPPEAPLVVTPEGAFLPEDLLSPSAVWAAITAPLTVVDIGDVAHQKVYASPSEKSEVLGTVHGQTQGLKVLELNAGSFARVGVYRHEDGEYIEGYIPQKKLKTIIPDTRYGVVIDKRDQTLTVYEQGRLLGTVSVSTGLKAENKLFRETRGGAFLTQDRIINFASEGYGYNYAIRIDGGNLIHSAGYKRYDGQKWDYSQHLSQLGEKASHGCVRVDTRPTESGINIYWLWTHLPIHTKVLVIDDAPAPVQTATEAPVIPTPTATPTPTFTPTPTLTPTFTPSPTPTPTPTVTATPAPSYEGLLSYRSRGIHVIQLQEKLKELNYYTSEVDGIFGDATYKAVVAFQKRNQLQADGMVGLMTFAALFGDDAVPTDTPKPTKKAATKQPPTPSPTPTLPPTPSPSPSPTPVPPDDVTLTLTFGGDTLLGSENAVRKRETSFDSVVDAKGYDYPLQNLAALFSSDDLTTLNLECVFKNDSTGKAEGRLFNFRGPTDHVNILTAASVEHVNLANNHFVDYGYAGKRTTRDTLTKAGIAYSGYGSTWIFEKDGVKIGFSGIRETIWHQDRSVPAQEIKELRKAGCDYVIYSCHFGQEYAPNRNADQELIAHMIIDAGADCVIGHHPHVVQGIEVYNGKPIFYSLGNLVFGGNLTPKDYDGLVVQLQLSFHKQKINGVSASLIPVMTSGVQDGTTDFQPVIAQGEDKARILQRIQNDSALTISEALQF